MLASQKERRDREVYMSGEGILQRGYSQQQRKRAENVARVCTIQRKIANDRREEEAIGVAQGLSLLKQQQ
jgi:hypothetical protein